ncbi:hypothetical protein CRG98_017691, partial [Punica granatum]
MSNRRTWQFLPALAVLLPCLVWISHGYTPPDSYLIDCGSQTNTTVGGRIFLADQSASNFLSTPQNVLAETSNSVPSSEYSQLYQTARIFTGTTKYTFFISRTGRHWIRLYLNPFPYDGFDMSTMKFAVLVQDSVLLNDFSVSSAIMREFSVNVTSGTFVITIMPSTGSFAFLNALEVVSMPDEIIVDEAGTLPPGKFGGLTGQTLETVWRVNMGGPLVSFRNDTLFRTWVPDSPFLINSNLAKNFSNIGAVKYVPGMATQDIAPRSVYGTVAEMNTQGSLNNNINVTWEFTIDVGARHLVRFHLCDIVSKSLNLLYFSVYIDSSVVAPDLDLSRISSNTLAAAYYFDIVTPVSESNKILVKVGPSKRFASNQNAILNGLEIMKLTDGNGAPSSSSSGKSVFLIAGVSGGVFVALVLFVGIGYLLCLRRSQRRTANSELSKSWIPLSTEGGTPSRSMGSKYSNGTVTTASPAHYFGYRFPFIAIQEATKNFGE